MSLVFLGGFAVLGLLILLCLLHLVDVIERKPSRGGKLVGRSEKTLKAFAQQAGEIQVSLRVARETYDVLMKHYPTPMCIDLRDNLRRDLDLSDHDILQLRSSLLTKTDRLESSILDVSAITTVHDLLLSIETAERSKVDRAALRLRVGDCPYPVRPVVETIEFKPTSEIIDPDYLRRQHFRWLRRRMSDYRGLLSRASDEAAKRPHLGPFRRSQERRPDASMLLDQLVLKGAKGGEEALPPSTHKIEKPIALDSPAQAPHFAAPAIRISGPEYPSR